MEERIEMKKTTLLSGKVKNMKRLVKKQLYYKSSLYKRSNKIKKKQSDSKTYR